MRISGKGCVLDGGEGRKSPPLPFIEVDENTARALVGTGMAVAYGGDAVATEDDGDGEAAQADLAANLSKSNDELIEQAIASPALPEPSAPCAIASPALPEVAEPDAVAQAEPEAVTEPATPNDTRRQTIADALELLEPEHLVKTGARAGKPKLNAMEDITGIRDLTVAEIDAVAAAKAAE